MSTDNTNSGLGTRRLTRVLLFTAMLCVSFAILTATSTQGATGYEPDIYESVEWFFWLFIIMADALSIGCALFVAISPRARTKNWGFFLAPALLANLTLLLLPMIRGYVVYGRADVLTHIGWINEILRTGSYGLTDIYPSEHILCASLAHVSLIDVNDLTKTLPGAVSILYLPFFFVMARGILRSERAVIASTALATILIFGNVQTSLAPYNQSLLMLPLILYVIAARLNETERWRYSLILSILTISAIFFHPLIALVVISFLILAGMANRRASREGVSRHSSDADATHPYRLVAIGLAGYLAWQSYAYLLIGSLEKVYFTLSGESMRSEFGTYQDLLLYAHPSSIVVITQALNTYGQLIVMGLISLFCVAVLVKSRIAQARPLGFDEALPLLGWTSFVGVSTWVFLFMYVVGFGRFYGVAMIFSTILIGSVLYGRHASYWTSNAKSRLAFAAIFAVAITLILTSTFNVFLSPRTMYPNQQVTEGEFAGMATFFECRDENLDILELGLSQSRFYDAIRGPDSPKVNIEYGSETAPPDHFGYDVGDFLGSTISNPNYLIVNNLGRNYYEYVYPGFEELWRFVEDDYIKLQSDPTVDSVFANGELSVFLIHPC